MAKRCNTIKQLWLPILRSRNCLANETFNFQPLAWFHIQSCSWQIRANITKSYSCRQQVIFFGFLQSSLLILCTASTLSSRSCESESPKGKHIDATFSNLSGKDQSLWNSTERGIERLCSVSLFFFKRARRGFQLKERNHPVIILTLHK